MKDYLEDFGKTDGQIAQEATARSAQARILQLSKNQIELLDERMKRFYQEQGIEPQQDDEGRTYYQVDESHRIYRIQDCNDGYNGKGLTINKNGIEPGQAFMDGLNIYLEWYRDESRFRPSFYF